jgi:hypothetical protein
MGQQISGGAVEVIPLYCKVDDNVIPHSWPPSYERIDKGYWSKFAVAGW